MGKVKYAAGSARDQRHDPLHIQLAHDSNTDHNHHHLLLPLLPASSAVDSRKRLPRKKFTERSERKDRKETEDFVDPKISKKILAIAREQQDEEEEKGAETLAPAPSVRIPRPSLGSYENDSDELEELEVDGDGFGEEYVEELELDEGDEDVLSKFLPSAPLARVNLADVIMQRINAQKGISGEAPSQKTDERSVPQGLNPKIIEAYTKVGHLLSRYTSGKVPKAFKIIPSLSNWEEILYLTEPENWTPHAVYQATRIFVSNLKAKQSQRFFQLVLLDRVRDDIAETKKLNYHLYMALKKALYKPAAFFKGILFPLCESGTCTLREAAIIGSVIAKVSIPVLHSSAALLKIAEMEYTGPNSLFIRILLDKKYALPFKVVDALVFHFIRFRSDAREMPVLWHQSFLVFAQRYKEDITPEQKEALLELLKHKAHEGISPEIRRELANSSCRGEIMDAPMDMDM